MTEDTAKLKREIEKLNAIIESSDRQLISQEKWLKEWKRVAKASHAMAIETQRQLTKTQRELDALRLFGALERSPGEHFVPVGLLDELREQLATYGQCKPECARRTALDGTLDSDDAHVTRLNNVVCTCGFVAAVMGEAAEEEVGH